MLGRFLQSVYLCAFETSMTAHELFLTCVHTYVQPNVTHTGVDIHSVILMFPGMHLRGKVSNQQSALVDLQVDWQERVAYEEHMHVKSRRHQKMVHEGTFF